MELGADGSEYFAAGVARVCQEGHVRQTAHRGWSHVKLSVSQGEKLGEFSADRRLPPEDIEPLSDVGWLQEEFMHELGCQALLGRRHRCRIRRRGAGQPVKPRIGAKAVRRVLEESDSPKERLLLLSQLTIGQRRSVGRPCKPLQSRPGHPAAIRRVEAFDRTTAAGQKVLSEPEPSCTRSRLIALRPGLAVAASSDLSTRSRATRSRLMAQPAGKNGNSLSACSRTVPCPGSMRALKRSSNRYSARCWPMKSNTRQEDLPSAVRSPRPNCCVNSTRTLRRAE